MPSVPTFDQFIEPLLRVLADRKKAMRTADVYEAVADVAGLTEDQRAEVLPSCRQAYYKNRIGWAHDRLKRAGLSESPKRGYWQLTHAGYRTAASDLPLSTDRIAEMAFRQRRLQRRAGLPGRSLRSGAAAPRVCAAGCLHTVHLRPPRRLRRDARRRGRGRLCPLVPRTCGTDCNDGDEDVSPGVSELCDGVDNNCVDGADEVAPTWYVDCDGDGFAPGPAGQRTGCEAPPTSATGCDGPDAAWTTRIPADVASVDCNDGDPGVFPGAAEAAICDGTDQDCDEEDDEGAVATLAVTVQGPGRVTTQGIDCGADCVEDNGCGVTRTLTAIAGASARFVQWEGDCAGTSETCVLTLDGNRTVVAVFEPVVTITVRRFGADQGTVTTDIGGVSCGSTCSTRVPPGTRVRFDAISGTFLGWSGLCANEPGPNTAPSFTRTVEADATIDAYFGRAGARRVVVQQSNNPSVQATFAATCDGYTCNAVGEDPCYVGCRAGETLSLCCSNGPPCGGSTAAPSRSRSVAEIMAPAGFTCRFLDTNHRTCTGTVPSGGTDLVVRCDVSD